MLKYTHPFRFQKPLTTIIWFKFQLKQIKILFWSFLKDNFLAKY